MKFVKHLLLLCILVLSPQGGFSAPSEIEVEGRLERALPDETLTM